MGKKSKRDTTPAGEVAKTAATIFVRNLPYDATNETLEKLFESIAPVRAAFVVSDGQGGCRGFGFVQFAFKDDVEKALKAGQTMKVGNRRISCMAANRRSRGVVGSDTPGVVDTPEGKETVDSGAVGGGDGPDDSNGDDEGDNDDNDDATTKKKSKKDKKKKKKKTEKEGKEEEEEEEEKGTDDSPAGATAASSATAEEQENKKKKGKAERKPASTAEGRTLVITGIGSDETKKRLYKRLRKTGDLESLELLEGCEEPTAHAVFATHKGARAAIGKIDGHEFHGAKLHCGLRTRKNPLGASTTTAASSSATTSSTSGSKKVPTKRARLIVRNLPYTMTEKALAEPFRAFGTVDEVRVPQNSTTGRGNGFGFVQMSTTNESAQAVQKLNGTELGGRTIAVDWALSKDEYEALRRKEEEETKQGEGEEEEEKGEKGEEDDDEKDYDDEEEDDESDGGSDSGGESDESGDEATTKGTKRVAPNDVDEGLTVFVTNLSFETTWEMLKERMESEYGSVVFVKLVMDRETGLPRGSAFVKFRETSGVESCLAAATEDRATLYADETSGAALVVDGRALHCTRAVSRDDAVRMAEERKGRGAETIDKRNMRLAFVGRITQESPDANGISAEDLRRRKRCEQEKRAKLKNPNYFVSSTRLSVRNLPLELTDKQLKKLCVGYGKVESCLVVRQKERVDAKGVGRSKGFGFVEYATHEEALKALKALNNNPDTFTTHVRPIVEFSVEDHRALHKQELRKRRIEGRTAKGTGAQKGQKKEEQNEEEGEEKGQEGTKKEKKRKRNESDATGSDEKKRAKPNTQSAPSVDANGKGKGKGKKQSLIPKAMNVFAKTVRSDRPKKRSREDNQEDEFENMVQKYRKRLANRDD